jgi:hypothetical protein
VRVHRPPRGGSSIGEASALAAALESADDFARDWGCPAAGHATRELTGELAALAKHTARVVGVEPATTCPFACLMRADPWVAELSDAARIAEAYHTPLPDILGRPLTAADVAALSEIQRGRADAWESDEKIREESRPKR